MKKKIFAIITLMISGCLFANIVNPAEITPHIISPSDGQTAIQDKINLLSSSGGGEIKLLPGTYVCKSPITIFSNGITISGSGKRQSILLFSGSSDGLVLDGSSSSIRYCNIDNLIIQGSGATGSGLKLINSVENTFINISITGFQATNKYGLEFSGTSGNSFYNYFSTCTFAGNANGALNYGQVNQYLNCRFQGNKGVGLLDYGTAPSFIGCGFEGNGSYGVETSQNGGKSFLGCYWERNIGAALICSQTNGLLISGGRVSAGATPCDKGFVIGRSSGSTPFGVVIQGILFSGPHKSAAIHLVGATDISVFGNSFLQENVRIISGKLSGSINIQK